MSNIDSLFGIKAYGVTLGEPALVKDTAKHYVDDPEKVMQWGCDTYHCASEDVFGVDLAFSASNKALSHADIAADQVDMVVYATSEMPEYLYWDSAAALARRLNCERVKTMLLNNEGCGAGIKALSQVAGVFLSQPAVNTILLSVTNRVSEYHRNRMNINNAVHSDGAVTVILERGFAHNRYLASEHFCYPEFCDFFRGDYGGAKVPVLPDDLNSSANAGYIKLHEHFAGDVDRMQYFLKKIRLEKLIEVLECACKNACIAPSMLSHLFYINDARVGAIEEIAANFNLSLEQTNYKLATQYGHVGAADQLLALCHGLGEDLFKSGDYIGLCGISTGMQWCACVFSI